MTGIYKIADKTIEIISMHENVHTLCKDYIYEGTPDFSVKTEQQDIDFERMHSAEEEYAASFIMRAKRKLSRMKRNRK